MRGDDVSEPDRLGPLTADDDNLISGHRILDSGEVDTAVLQRGRTDQRSPASANEDHAVASAGRPSRRPMGITPRRSTPSSQACRGSGTSPATTSLTLTMRVARRASAGASPASSWVCPPQTSPTTALPGSTASRHIDGETASTRLDAAMSMGRGETSCAAATNAWYCDYSAREPPASETWRCV